MGHCAGAEPALLVAQEPEGDIRLETNVQTPTDQGLKRSASVPVRPDRVCAPHRRAGCLLPVAKLFTSRFHAFALLFFVVCGVLALVVLSLALWWLWALLLCVRSC